MNNNERRQLEGELRQVGASSAEVAELLPIATKLRLLANKESAATETFPVRRQKSDSLKPIAIGVIILVAALTVVVLLSQSVLPGSPLYPVQEFSDKVAVALHPAYRSNVMMRRARQVRLLVEQHASSDLVLATLADYQTEASTYQTKSANYEAFEYCKDNLQQASAIAPGPVRPTIDKVLASLKDV